MQQLNYLEILTFIKDRNYQPKVNDEFPTREFAFLVLGLWTEISLHQLKIVRTNNLNNSGSKIETYYNCCVQNCSFKIKLYSEYCNRKQNVIKTGRTKIKLLEGVEDISKHLITINADPDLTSKNKKRNRRSSFEYEDDKLKQAKKY